MKVEPSEDYSKFSVMISEESCQKILTNIITGVSDPETTPQIIYYPNPTSSVVTIRASNHEDIISNFTVRNVLGMEIKVPLLTAQGEYQIDLTDQQPGIYLIEFWDGKTRGVLRIVKY